MIGLPRNPTVQDPQDHPSLLQPGAAIRGWTQTLSRREHAYRGLASLIRSGMLRAGDALPSERLLSRVFDIARGSVRMVLDELKCDGVIRISQGKKTLVIGEPLPRGTPFHCEPSAPLTHQGQFVIEHARRLASTLALSTALCPVDACAARRLGFLVETQSATNDLPQFLIIDHQFHTELQTCYPTRKFASLLRLAGELAHSGLRDVFEAEAARRDVVAQHLAIVRAIEHKAIGAAVVALCDHLEMRVAAYRELECETPAGGHAKSNGGVAQTTPLQDVLGIWRRCGDSS